MTRRKKIRIDAVTLFPEMFEGPTSLSIVSRAREKGLLELGFTNPREFTNDRHKTVDDRPYGGGAGMVLMAEPFYQAIRKVKKRASKVLLMSPQGRRFDQEYARRLSQEKHLILLCGHYEGFDERLSDYVDEEVSIGDYVLTGGELPAMVIIDSIARLLPGVLAKDDAALEESFTGELLDYPQYTRPRVWRGKETPEILLGGDHAKIAAWRKKAAKESTRRKRPDRLKNKV